MTRLRGSLRLTLLAAFGLLALGAVWVRSHDHSITAHAAATDTVTLTAGLCNNVALTWPAGTPIGTVVAAVSPSNAVESVWRQTIVNDMRVFIAYSPIQGAPNDYTATDSSLEAAFVCVTAGATLTRPDR